MNIRMFWIKDVVNKKLIEIKHTRTEKMLADPLSKPTFGKLFRVMFDEITGTPVEYRDGEYICFSIFELARSTDLQVGSMLENGKLND